MIDREREYEFCHEWAKLATAKWIVYGMPKIDVYQSVFLVLWRQRTKNKNTVSPTCYKYWWTAAYRAVHDLYMRKIKTGRVSKKHPTLFPFLSEHKILFSKSYEQIIDEVPPVKLDHLLQPIVDLLLQGKKMREIAQIMGLKLTTIQTRNCLIRKAFAEYWKTQL
jgi:DNA-directed RNA polymerase specialized sigma24 family protein